MTEICLFNRKETITRTTSEGFINDDEEFVAGATQDIEIDCSIQPYREGKNSFNNPTGYRTIDAYRVYSKQELIAADEIDHIVGDQITIKGKQYFCKDLEVWDEHDCKGLSLIPEHYLGYFYRKDKT